MNTTVIEKTQERIKDVNSSLEDLYEEIDIKLSHIQKPE